MKSIGTLVLMLVSVFCFGQSKRITSIKTSSEVVYTAVDRAGDFYIVLKSGDIQKYDKNGASLGSYSHEGIPTIFDPSNAIRLLVYYKKGQQYTWLSPDLSVNAFQSLDASLAIDASMMCPSGDQNVWVLDNADLSLKKINLNESRVLSEFMISNQFKENDFTLMREYQNFLFLLDPLTGIFAYNSLGNSIHRIQTSGLTTFNFLGEELYYSENGKIKFLDLFTMETRELNLPQPAQFVLLTDERMVLSTQYQVDIFEFMP